MGFEDCNDPAQQPIDREEFEAWEKAQGQQLNAESLSAAIEATNEATKAGEMESEQLEAGIKAYVSAEIERVKKENFCVPLLESTDPDKLPALFPAWHELVNNEQVINPVCNKFFTEQNLIIAGLYVQGFKGHHMETYSAYFLVDEVRIETREENSGCRHCSCFENGNDDGRYICCDCFNENRSDHLLEPLTEEEKETGSADNEPRKKRVD